MKKTFLNVRKMGFVLVAATSMLAFSCGGGEEETTEGETTEGETTEEVTEEVTEEACEEGACEEGQCDGGTCEGGDSTAMEESCDGGQ